MARPSSIDRLPREVREKIAGLRRAGHTIDEILANLARLDVDVSRSALARHTHSLDELAAYLKRSRSMAEATMERIENQGPSKVARLNVELLHGVMQELVVAASCDENLTLDAKAVKFLAEATEKLTKASKTATDEEIRSAALAQAAARLDAAAQEAQDAGENGLTPDRLAQLRRDFLGIKPQQN